MRYIVTFTLGFLCAVLPASAMAQDWATAMFREMSHDFGTVAAYAKTEHRFQVTNKYKETMQLTSVTTSCGCTTPSISKQSLKTGETSEIVAVFNSHSFRGKHSAVLTVTFGGAFFAQVQLRVSGFIRGDVVLNPPQLAFDRVQLGTAAEKAIDVSYAGRNDWKIVDVRGASDYLVAELKETRRGGGLVDYRLTVRLKDNAPAGYLHEQLSLVTNDDAGNRIPVDVEGKVEAELTASPSPLVFGAVTTGEKASKKVVIRGSKPFRLTAVNCPEWCTVQLPKEAKTFHVVEVNLLAAKGGDLAGKILFQTDLGPASPLEVAVHAQASDALKQP